MKEFLIIIAIVLAIAAILFCIHWYKNHATKKQKAQIKAWMLGAVAEAQHDLQDGTGPLKLSVVYGVFVGLFPWLAVKVPFPIFELMVKETLILLDKIKKEKPKIESYLNGEVISNEKSNIY